MLKKDVRISMQETTTAELKPRMTNDDGRPQGVCHNEPYGEEDVHTEEKFWYALRVTYARELKVKQSFDEKGIESYVPMRMVERRFFGKRRKRLVPAIHNLIFVHIERARMKEIKSTTDMPIRYIMDRESKSPVIVPDKQMADFIAVAKSDNEHVEFISPDAISIKSGERVRVIDGAFKGVEGEYIRYKGHSKVAISIRNVLSVVTAYVPLRYIEKIEP